MPTTRVRRFLPAFFLLVTATATRADHDVACRALPTSAQRPVQVPCNPRQKCLDGVSGSGPARTAAEQACRTLPTTGTCPGTQTWNPREECIQKLPKPSEVKIDTVAGSAFASGDAIKNIRADQYLVVRGKNVGMTGIKMKGEQGDFSIGRRQAGIPGCDAPNCVALDVKGNARWTDICEEARGRRSFTLTEALNHNSARGSFRIAPNDITPRPPDLPRPQASASVTYLQIGPFNFGNHGGFVRWGWERNAITIRRPKTGTTKVVLRTGHDRVGTDVLSARIDATGMHVQSRQGGRFEPALRGSDAQTIFFEMWVDPPRQSCDPQPEGILHLAVESENGATREKATAAYWIPPRN